MFNLNIVSTNTEAVGWNSFLMCVSAKAWQQGDGADLLWPRSWSCACACTAWLRNLALLILNYNGVYIIELMQVILRYKMILRYSDFSFPVDELVHLLKLLNTTIYRFVALLIHVLEGGRHSHFSLEVCLCIEVHLIFLFINVDSKYLCIKNSGCPNPWLLDIRVA